MTLIQRAEEIEELLARHLQGSLIRQIQILAPNALKSLQPTPDAFADHHVTATACADRRITITTVAGSISIDLQRTGRIKWLASAAPWGADGDVSRPTLRLLLGNGSALDLTEPGRTKRITITLASRTGSSR